MKKNKSKRAVMDDIVDLIGTMLIIFILFIFLNFFKASAVTVQKETIKNSVDEVKTKHYLNTILRLPVNENKNFIDLLESYTIDKEKRVESDIKIANTLDNFFKDNNEIKCFSFLIAKDLFSLNIAKPINRIKVCDTIDFNKLVTEEMKFYNKNIEVALYVEYNQE